MYYQNTSELSMEIDFICNINMSACLQFCDCDGCKWSVLTADEQVAPVFL